MALTDLLWNGPRRARGTPRLLLAHGAGAPMDSLFMNEVANQLSELGIAVARFEFPYMQRRRVLGMRSPPDRAPVLLECYRQVVSQLGAADRLVIGGKSLGGRMASMLADELGVAGVVCLGYPFHPPGKPERLRTEHLATLRSRALIVQGTRDAFGTREEVEGYRLSKRIRVSWVEQGNHDLSPPKRAHTPAELAQIRLRWLKAVASFVRK